MMYIYTEFESKRSLCFGLYDYRFESDNFLLYWPWYLYIIMGLSLVIDYNIDDIFVVCIWILTMIIMIHAPIQIL